MKSNVTMLTYLCRKYRNDMQHRTTVNGIKCVSLSYGELQRFYVEHGFDVLDKKKECVLDRHIKDWEYLGRAKKCYDGTILIQLSAVA